MVGGPPEAFPESFHPLLFLGHKAKPYCPKGCPLPSRPLRFLPSSAGRGKGQKSEEMERKTYPQWDLKTGAWVPRES